jgi:radical SAM protein with 4Fe4S-binding SPASM domain
MPSLHLPDLFNLFTKLSLRRTLNGMILLVSFVVSRVLGKPVIWGRPIAVTIEPTTACNLGCPECPSGLRSFTRPTGSIKSPFFKETIDALHRDLLYVSFYFQGEPFLNKGLTDMIQYAASKNIYTAVSTNAHFLDDDTARRTVESGLDRLIISVDGATQDTYEKYRVGGSLPKVMEGASNMVKWKRRLKCKKPFLIFQFLVVKPNEHEVAAMQDMARQVGVDALWLKSAQVQDFENDPNGLIPTLDQYSRYQKDRLGKTQIKNKMPNHCWKMWHGNVISWDGRVLPCCFDKDAAHQLGDLNSTTMEEIWKNKKYRKFRTELMQSRKNIDICANCSEGLRIWN